MNETRTASNSGTNLTQARSLVVLDFERPPLPFDITAARSFIYAERRAVGAHSRLGRRFSLFGEQIENFVKAVTLEQAVTLAFHLIETYEEIKALTRVRIAAPTLMLAGPVPKGEA